ncbi:uncharacterized protein LOC124813407 [Hydra vulgaris]|uniref:uncharacterized protein LOC124813407 n=1 Tax=Hydra vulgaris TaxID=6087 RepID=UPI0032E9D9E8
MATSSDFFKKTLNVPALVEKAACSNKTPGYKTISAEATVPNSALKLVLDKLATMQQETLHISQVQQNMFNAFQKMVAVKKRELPECVELPVKTLLELKSLEKNLDKKDLAQAVVRFHSQKLI